MFRNVPCVPGFIDAPFQMRLGMNCLCRVCFYGFILAGKFGHVAECTQRSSTSTSTSTSTSLLLCIIYINCNLLVMVTGVSGVQFGL